MSGELDREQLWDHRFVQLANQVARWSKDPNTKVGAVIVSPDRRKFSVGYNGFPKGIDDNRERLDNREDKLSLTIHAEHNAIINAPFDTNGCSIYITKPACKTCALTIIQAGIIKIVQPELDPECNWYDSQRAALFLFKEAGISIPCHESRTYYE